MAGWWWSRTVSFQDEQHRLVVTVDADLYSSLSPNAMTTSPRNSLHTCLAAQFMSSSAAASLGFAKLCAAENLSRGRSSEGQEMRSKPGLTGVERDTNLWNPLPSIRTTR